MDYVIKDAVRDMANQISAVWLSGWHDGHDGITPPALVALRTAQSFYDRTLDNLSITRVALCGSDVFGFYMVHQDELYQMYVDRRARGTGLAQALIKDAETRIQSAGHRVAWLACAIGNEPARRFYEKSGGVNAGRHTLDMDTAQGPFPLDVWKFEKTLSLSIPDPSDP